MTPIYGGLRRVQPIAPTRTRARDRGTARPSVTLRTTEPSKRDSVPSLAAGSRYFRHIERQTSDGTVARLRPRGREDASTPPKAGKSSFPSQRWFAGDCPAFGMSRAGFWGKYLLTPEPSPDCANCGASITSCETREWLSGRRCCDGCDHANESETD
jgi:hypothetical protein